MRRSAYRARESLESAVAKGRRKEEEAALDPPTALDCAYWLIAPAAAPSQLDAQQSLPGSH